MPRLLDTRIENRELVLPNHANNLGTVHGGNIMKWMDEIGALSAMRFAGRVCVTARMDRVNFRAPIPVGETALIEAYVYAAGRTSVRVRIEAARENPLTSEVEPTTESTAVYVAIDGDRNPVEVPDLTVETDDGRRLRNRAFAADQDADTP